MRNKFDISALKMTYVLKQWVADRLPEYKDTISICPNFRTSHFVGTYAIRGEYQYLLLELDAQKKRFSVSLESPWTLDATKTADMSRMIGLINQRLPFGALFCIDKGDHRYVTSKLALNVDADSFTPHQISSTVVAGASIFENYHKPLSTVALTNKSADKVWTKFLCEESKLAKGRDKGRAGELDSDELRDLVSFGEIVPYKDLWELGPVISPHRVVQLQC